MVRPLDELIGFLKQGDNYTQDTREWPDPTEPRASKPPEPKGCTCQQGLKLECPIHGLNADPELVEMDHTWSMPQAQPIGYQQDGPRNWTQAVSRFSPRHVQTGDAGDTNSRASQSYQHDRARDSNTHLDAAQLPELLRVRDLPQNRRFVPFGIGGLDLPKFSSFVVSDRQDKPVESLSDLSDDKSALTPFGVFQHGAPFAEHAQDDPHGVGCGFKNRSSFGVHGSTAPFGAEEFVVTPEHRDHFGQYRAKTPEQASDPTEDAKRRSNASDIETNARPPQDVKEREQVISHKWSVTRVGMKLRPYKDGKYGKGMIDENGDGLMLWRVRGGWNGQPHHDKVQEVLGLKDEMVAFHIDKDCSFYFHEEDQGFFAPADAEALAATIEREQPDLHWGRISVEEYERQHEMKESSTERFAATIAEMQTAKAPRRLVIHRDQEGRMAAIDEVPIT